MCCPYGWVMIESTRQMGSTIVISLVFTGKLSKTETQNNQGMENDHQKWSQETPNKKEERQTNYKHTSVHNNQIQNICKMTTTWLCVGVLCFSLCSCCVPFCSPVHFAVEGRRTTTPEKSLNGSTILRKRRANGRAEDLSFVWMAEGVQHSVLKF